MAVKVMLDAGHYGKRNQSPIVPEYYESDFTWKLHLLLKAELEKYGIEVGTTRSDKDKDLEVTKRGKSAKGYDLLVSLHSNARDNTTTDRVVIYRQIYGLGARTSLEMAEELAPYINQVMECPQNPNVKVRKSDKGEWDYYGILRGAASVNVPAIIIEHSYHTTERSAMWLMKDKNLQDLAEVEADRIAAHFGISVLRGDVNGDGKITAKDYLLAQRIVLGTYTPTPAELKRCDIDGDGKVTARDYLLIKRTVLGTI